ncbi:MAG: hypothetical protein ACOY94_28700 [Bacillota bacterium]
MDQMLNVLSLEAMGARYAMLSVGRYGLPVRFRIRGRAVECRVPTWSGVGDLLEGLEEVLLVAVVETEPYLRWLFLRGPASIVPDPDWEGLEPPPLHHLVPDDLYQILRIEPRRIERVDEQRGWGYRETADT